MRWVVVRGVALGIAIGHCFFKASAALHWALPLALGCGERSCTGHCHWTLFHNNISSIALGIAIGLSFIDTSAALHWTLCPLFNTVTMSLFQCQVSPKPQSHGSPQL